MVFEELGLSAQSLVLLIMTFVFLYWLMRYAERMKQDAQERRMKLEEDMRELEDVAKKLENDLDSIFKKLDSKVDQTQLELKLDELDRKRAELIQSAVELKKKEGIAEPKKRAQASIELIAIFTLLLIPIIAGFIYAYSAVSDSVKYKADVSLDRISSAAERLYVEGPGATSVVFVDLPAGIDYPSSYIGSKTGGEGKYLSLNVSGSEAFRLTDATIAGNWQNTTGNRVKPGFNAFNLTVNSSGCVVILPR